MRRTLTLCMFMLALVFAIAAIAAEQPAKPKTTTTKTTTATKTTATKKTAQPAAKSTAKQTSKNIKPAEKKVDKPKKLPKLVDLGRETCIPCKKMVPVLNELRKDYKGQLEVVFINTEKDPDAVDKYKIQMIPTQIFYDANGKEFYRHQGFYSTENIVAKFKEHKIELKKK